ncbi:MAG: hypothetical protein V3R78_10035 [Thermodesulfobacteriota bacterium]
MDNQGKLYTCPACGDYGFSNPPKQCAKTGWVESKDPEPINSLLLEACKEAYVNLKSEIDADWNSEESEFNQKSKIERLNRLESAIKKAEGE